MSQKTPIYLFYALVIVGLADSLYLAMTVLLAIAPVCGSLHGCETVAASPYSRLFGVPLSYLGVLYYTAGALLGGFLFDSRPARSLSLWYGLIGAGLSTWFVYIQAALIGAYCIYCLLSAAVSFGFLGVGVVLFKKRNSGVIK